MPSPDTCVLRDVLERRAKEAPESCFVTFEDGTSWSYAQLLGHTRRAAAALQHLGVCQDDRVLLWMANGPDALRLWFSINWNKIYLEITKEWLFEKQYLQLV